MYDPCFDPVHVCVLRDALINYINGSGGHLVPDLCLDKVKT